MRKRPLAYIACVFLAGFAYQQYKSNALIDVIMLLILQEILQGIKSRGFVKMAGRSVILLSVFLLGISHMQREEAFRDAYMSKIVDGSEVTVWGELIKTEITDWGIRGILSDCYIHLEEDTLPCNDIMVYFSSDHFQMGQIHKITGKVNMFSEARNQGNFDLRAYYQSQKIDFAVYEEEGEILSQGLRKGKQWLLSLREKISGVFVDNMQEKAAGFYQGMVLGDKTNLDETLKDLFTLGGISHILAISGLHVSIIGRGVYQRLRKWGLGFLISGIFGGCLLVAYCIMVGNGMSTVRAVGMMLIYFLAQCMGRSYDMLNGLGAMVLVLLWENPFLIEYSGFWFSVMALVGIGFVGKELSNKVGGLAHEERIKNIVASLWMSLGITLTTLPITACSYFEIPMYSTLVNFVALPILTPIFCLAIAGGVLGLWFPPVARILLMPCEWLLSFYEWLCDTTSRLPWASVICGEPTKTLVVVYYLVLFGGVLLLRTQREKELGNQKLQTQLGGIHRCNIYAIILSVCCFVLICYPKAKPFEITFLDVGQGDGIYISAGDGTTYFIDGGSTSVDGVGEYRILPFLKSKDVDSIDYWFVSHCDTDHISGLLEVLESGYEIKSLVVARHCPKDEAYEKLISVAEEAETEVLYMDVGHQISSKNIEITCLAPASERVTSVDRNEASLVLEVECKEIWKDKQLKLLFAGDISEKTELALLEAGGIGDIDIYKASHHGSKYSNCEELLAILNPEIAVISCSSTNNYGHPSEEVISRMKAEGAEIFYTMKNGQVTVVSDEKGMRVALYIRN